MNNLIANAALSNLIHIPHTTDTKLTQLSEGQLLRATVQRVTDDAALLNIGGKAITVKTEVPLEPQQRVILQVTQANTDQISLQIVSQSAAPGATGGQTAALLPSNLELLLSSWGLEADSTNQLIAKALFHHAHSLDPEAVQTVRSLWQQLPALTSLVDAQGGRAGALETLVYLHTNQLPVNQESLTLAHHLLNNPIDIAQRLTDLQQALRTVQSQLQTLLGQTQGSTSQTQTQAQTQAQALIQSLTGQSNAAPLNQLLTTINSALNHMGSWTISADTPPAEIAARLANLITNLGTPPETSLARQVASQLSAPQPGLANGAGQGGPSAVIHQAGPEAASQPAGSAAATGPQAANQSGAPASLAAESGTSPGTSLPAQPQANQASGLQMSAQIRPGGTFENPLQQLAATLSEALSNPNLDEPTTQALRTLSHRLETITKDLGAIQFSNLTNAAEPATEPYYLFPIPLTTSDGAQTAQLKVYRRHRAGKLDPDNLRLALLLDLPEIGEIAVNLTVFKKHLNGQFLSRRESTHHLVETSLDELQQSLSDLGYRVDALSSDLLSANEPLSLDEPGSLESIEVPMPQINITA